MTLDPATMLPTESRYTRGFGGGLLLTIWPSGRRTWWTRHRTGDTARERTKALGAWPAISEDEARERAAVWLAALGADTTVRALRREHEVRARESLTRRRADDDPEEVAASLPAGPRKILMGQIGDLVAFDRALAQARRRGLVYWRSTARTPLGIAVAGVLARADDARARAARAARGGQ